MSEAKVKVVEDLPGVGPAIAEKLRDAGYDTLEAIGTQAPGTLSDATGIGKESCSKFIAEARKASFRPPHPSHASSAQLDWDDAISPV